jgi:hypothetical protein
MDHEVFPRPCTICDWLLNLSWDHFSLHQGKNVKVTMEFEVPKRHLLRPTLSIDMVQQFLQRKRQKRYYGKKKKKKDEVVGIERKEYYNKICNEIFFGKKEDEDKRRQKNGQI